MAVPKKAKPVKRVPGKGRPTPKRSQPRMSKYPWDEIEALFVHGENDKDANGVPMRTQPSVSDMARKYNAPVTTVSQRANTKDANGNTWYDKRNAYLTKFKDKRDTKIAEEIVDQEVAFRKTTLAVGQMVVQHVAVQLHRGLRKDTEGNTRSVLDPDALTKLAAAGRKGQEMGLISMDRSADGPGDQGGMDDWTLMRKVRAGALGGPAADPLK